VAGRFDHVVVGAGAAGCVVARRLADAGRRVLVVEAGPPGGADAPAAVRDVDFLAACAEPGWTWDLTARRTPAQGVRPYLRGRGVGGSTAVNAGVVVRPPRADYGARWGRTRAVGGFGGAVEARAIRAIGPVRHPLGPVAAAVGAAFVADGLRMLGGTSAGAAVDGWCAAALAQHGGRRRSAADVWLAGAPPTLSVRTGATVERVLLDGRRAVGVALAGGEVVEAAHVVCAAGAIHTPVLLARSGVQHPALGAGLADHPAVAFTLSLRPGARLAAGGAVTPITGLARWSSGVGGGVLDIQALVMDHVGAGVDARALGVVLVALMDVRSTGTVRVGDDGGPLVDVGMLADPLDRARLRAGVRRTLAVLARPEVRAVAEAVVGADGTPAGDLGALDDDALDAWCAAHLGDYVHAAGTCAIGPPGDPRGVVDLAGGVVGHEGLAVVDASVFPTLPRANTMLAAMTVADELAARLVAVT
jgi:5-(hydroxymethyl)furfural/furfural oxidase